MEAQLALTEVVLEGGDKLATKDATEHLDRKEEGVAWLDPTGAIERQSAGGHHTMHVGMMFELLIPGVEHAKEADISGKRAMNAFSKWEREQIAFVVKLHIMRRYTHT